jgi:hypothetical protein
MTKTNLAWTGIADFHVFIAKDFGTTGFIEADGFALLACCVELR